MDAIVAGALVAGRFVAVSLGGAVADRVAGWAARRAGVAVREWARKRKHSKKGKS